MDTAKASDAGVFDEARNSGGLDRALGDILAAGLSADKARANLLAAAKQVLAERPELSQAYASYVSGGYG